MRLRNTLEQSCPGIGHSDEGQVSREPDGRFFVRRIPAPYTRPGNSRFNILDFRRRFRFLESGIRNSSLVAAGRRVRLKEGGRSSARVVSRGFIVFRQSGHEHVLHSFGPDLYRSAEPALPAVRDRSPDPSVFPLGHPSGSGRLSHGSRNPRSSGTFTSRAEVGRTASRSPRPLIPTKRSSTPSSGTTPSRAGPCASWAWSGPGNRR